MAITRICDYFYGSGAWKLRGCANSLIEKAEFKRDLKLAYMFLGQPSVANDTL